MPVAQIAANAHTVVSTGWTSPSNAYSTSGDNTYATALNGTSSKNVTHSGDFGFPDIGSGTIPDGATINSVVIRCEVNLSASVTGGIFGVQGRLDGANSGTEATKTTTTEAEVATTMSGVTLADLRAASTDIKARCRGAKGNTTSALTVNLDYVRLEVDYSVGTNYQEDLGTSITATTTADDTLAMAEAFAGGTGGGGSPDVADFVETETNGTNTTNFTATKPSSLADGDYWFVFLSIDGQVTISPPDGTWTQVYQAGLGGTAGATGGLFYKRFATAASAPSTVTFTVDVAEKGSSIDFRGIDLDDTDPIDAQGTTGSENASTYTIAGLTTTVDDAILLALASTDTSTITFTPDSGWASELTGDGSDGAGMTSWGVWSKTKASAGTEAGASWAQSVAQEVVHKMVALAPGGGAGPTITATTTLLDTLGGGGFTETLSTSLTATTALADSQHMGEGDWNQRLADDFNRADAFDISQGARWWTFVDGWQVDSNTAYYRRSEGSGDGYVESIPFPPSGFYEITVEIAQWERITTPTGGEFNYMQLGLQTVFPDTLENHRFQVYQDVDEDETIADIFDGSSTTYGSAAYNGTNHRWFRIRQDPNGDVLWFTSPDGQDWTEFASTSAATGFTDDLRVVLYADHTNTFDFEQRFDNLMVRQYAGKRKDTSITGTSTSADAAGRSEAVTTNIVATTTTTDGASGSESLSTSIVATTTANDALNAGGTNYTEDLSTSITATTTLVDDLALSESLTTTVTATTTTGDTQAAAETLTTSVTATTTADDQLSSAGSEDLSTSITATTTTADSQAMFEAGDGYTDEYGDFYGGQVDITATTTVIDTLNAAGFSETLDTSITATVSGSDSLASSDDLATSIVATTSIFDGFAGANDLATAITATTTSGDTQDGAETLTVSIVATTTAQDLLANQGLEELSTAISATTALSDALGASETLSVELTATTTVAGGYATSDTIALPIVCVTLLEDLYNTGVRGRLAPPGQTDTRQATTGPSNVGGAGRLSSSVGAGGPSKVGP